MDLALTLFSSGIDCIPTFADQQMAWGVIVFGEDENQSLNLYSELKSERDHTSINELEEARTTRTLSLEIFFNGVVWGWLALLAFLFVWSPESNSQLKNLGILNSMTFKEAEYYRLITSISLHGDFQHLFLNIVFGILFISLACWKHGTGLGLVFSLLSGACANAVYCLYKSTAPDNWASLGASCMIFASLGLMVSTKKQSWNFNTKQIIPLFRKHRSMIGAISLFGLMGLNPSSNWIAHLAGLVFGILSSFLLENWLSKMEIYRQIINITSVIIFLIIVWVCWVLAIVS